MPVIPLHPPDPHRGSSHKNDHNPLPQLLKTPSGLAILELQGTINIPPISHQHDENMMALDSSTSVGKIVFPNYRPDDVTASTSWMKQVHLYVGRHQRLTGEVQKLSTPLAIIRRKFNNHHENESSGEELEVAEIIYYKILFSSRPEPSFVIFILWAIAVSIRNVYFHPLSRFPGPKNAAATPLPFVRNQSRGNQVNWVMQLHAKYGEIVRIAPDELSFINLSAWHDIGLARPELPRGAKGTLASPNGHADLGSETNREKHTRQRKIMSHAFSDRALKSQEDILKHYSDLLITKLWELFSQAEKSSITLDMTRWYNYTTFDTIGDLLLNDPFHSLENSADHPWVTAIFEYVKFGVIITSLDWFPPLGTIVRALIPPSMKQIAKQHFEWSQEKITRRIESGSKRPDFITYILDNNGGGDKLTRDELDSQAALIILAGSETSATTCTSTTYFFLKHPHVYARLQKEVRDAFGSFDEMTVSATAKLPYLHAVITEALRLHPPVSTATVRQVDRHGVKICGYDVPIGTRVGIPQKTMSRSATNFVDPNSFVPERWLPEADAKYQADRKGASEPFSARVGRNEADIV
ncbi:MAG: hypothetical protein Q9220_006610 [cf. Caloplaca sp. 1 TL-2023]